MSLLTLLQLDLGVAQLQVAARGVGAVTASLSVRHNLTAAPIGVGSATGVSSVRHNLATASVGIGTTSGSLSLRHLLSVSQVGVGSVSGTLTSSHPALPALQDFEEVRLAATGISTEVRTF